MGYEPEIGQLLRQMPLSDDRLISARPQEAVGSGRNDSVTKRGHSVLTASRTISSRSINSRIRVDGGASLMVQRTAFHSSGTDRREASLSSESAEEKSNRISIKGRQCPRSPPGLTS